MKYEKVLYEKKDGQCIITLNEPEKMNGLSEPLVTDLIKALSEAEKDKEIRVIVITGKGKAFSAGGDISVFDRKVVGGYDYIKGVMDLLFGLEKILKPTIAAVNGFALGGGSELMMACDITIASDEASFGFPEVSIGIMPGFAIIRLHQIVGRTIAKELILTGKRISAKEAEKIGLVNKVVPSDKLMNEVENTAKVLMNNAPLSLRIAKSIINRELGGEEIVSTVNATSLFWGFADLQEGMDAFFKKRKPMYKGE